MNKSAFTTRNICVMAMMSAISVVLVYLIRFPIFPSAPFLEYDPADIPIIITTLMFGTVPGIMVTAVVCVVQGLTVSAQSGIIGIIMHFVATGTLVLIVGLINGKKHGQISWRQPVSLALGSLAMVAMMVLWNIIFTPIFMGAPRQAVIEMLVPVIIPFNLIKACGNSLLSGLLYIALRQAFKKANILTT